MTRTNAAPEAMLQKQVVDFLSDCAPADLLWSATLGGVSASRFQANKNKAQGLRKGVPDLVFVLPSGDTVWVEMKRPDGGVLSAEQKRWRDQLGTRWACCRSVGEVRAFLIGHGVDFRQHPFWPLEKIKSPM